MQEIGGYRIVRRIGSGGMGTVHEALDAEDRRVALKLLHPQISHDPSARARLAREVDLLHRVRGKGVARVLDAEVEDDEAFVVTELIDGPTLEDDVVAHGPFSPDELRALAHGLADALHAIHRVGVVHRDLKPGNVMLSRSGPVIIDFGIAQVADDVRLTQTGMVTGTPGYLDPEVVDGAAPSPVCDWWAWAAVLVFAATGRRPFGTGPSVAVIKRMSLGQVDLDAVDPLPATALWAALQPDPSSRLDPHSVLAVLDGRWDRGDLDEALASLRLRPPGEDRTAVVPAAPSPTLVMPTTSPPPLVTPTSPAARETRVEPVRQAPPASRPGGSAEPDAWQEPPAWARPPVRRSGTIAALGFFLVAAAGIWPGVAILTFAAVLLLAGTVGYARRSMLSARLRRGPRPGDVARAVATSPWFVVRSALVTVGLSLLGAGTAWVALQLASFLLPELGQWQVVREHLLLSIGAAVAVAVTWFGPGAGVHREGARSLVAALLPYPAMRLALAALSTLLGLGFLVAAATGSFPEPVWQPLPTPAWLLL
ncbi:MAG: protein kinase domain-containing protein [Actinomycetota bacterium]